VIRALEQRQYDCEDEKRCRRVLGYFGEHRAGAGAEQSVRPARAEGQHSPGLLLRELDKDEKYQDGAVQHHRQGQKHNDKSHNSFLNRVLDYISKTAGFK